MITDIRTKALSQINRFNGHTIRPYSVLEHTVLGVHVGRAFGMERHELLGFLLHDYEESVFGDHIRPTKQKYLNNQYTHDVMLFNTELELQYNVKLGLSSILAIDDDMLAAELETIVPFDDPKYRFNPDKFTHVRAADLINFGKFSEPEYAITEFNRLLLELTE